MSAKIRIKLGNIEIEFEGNESFLDKKLPQLIDHLSKLKPLIDLNDTDGGNGVSGGKGSVPTLAKFLGEKKAKSSQVRKFLATATWLSKKGTKTLKSPDVSKALKESSQTRLSNAADCLNKNVSKGFCEKDGDSFFVTEDGLNDIK